jgi:hypothetical protein
MPVYYPLQSENRCFHRRINTANRKMETVCRLCFTRVAASNNSDVLREKELEHLHAHDKQSDRKSRINCV